MTEKTPKPPSELRTSGRRLWKSVLTEFDLDEHERQILREACRTSDLVDRLQAQVDNDGVMAESSQGVRVHPAAPELRAQRVVLARLFAALNLPSGEESETGTTQHRPVRGVYGIKGAS